MFTLKREHDKLSEEKPTVEDMPTAESQTERPKRQNSSGKRVYDEICNFLREKKQRYERQSNARQVAKSQ